MTVIPIRPVPLPEPAPCPRWCDVEHDEHDDGTHSSPYVALGDSSGALARLWREPGCRTVVTTLANEEYEDYSLAAAFLAGGTVRRLAIQALRR